MLRGSAKEASKALGVLQGLRPCKCVASAVLVLGQCTALPPPPFAGDISVPFGPVIGPRVSKTALFVPLGPVNGPKGTPRCSLVTVKATLPGPLLLCCYADLGALVDTRAHADIDLYGSFGIVGLGDEREDKGDYGGAVDGYVLLARSRNKHCGQRQEEGETSEYRLPEFRITTSTLLLS